MTLRPRSTPVWIILFSFSFHSLSNLFPSTTVVNRYLPVIQHFVGMLALRRGYRLMNLLEVLEKRVAEAQEIKY